VVIANFVYCIPIIVVYMTMNNVQDLLSQVSADVDDIIQKDFTFIHVTEVPQVDDANLTYESGKDKRGEEIDTCVLFVDIRNSVALNSESKTKTMGRIYTAFTKSVISAADKCGGLVRNIIGDRVMVVFPEADCYQNAVECAISINHIAQKIINQKLQGHDFKCGIGIDYGKIRCIKVGKIKKGAANQDYKNLVWIGRPANMASRLCDNANKEVQMFKVEYRKLMPVMGLLAPQSILSGNFEFREVTEYMTAEQLTELISKIGLSNIHLIIKEGMPEKRKPILISKDVYDGYKKACPEADSIKNHWWHEDNKYIRNVDFKVYGADITWKV